MVKGTRFTDRFIMNLKPAIKEYWTREGMGFSIRVLPSGEKTWYYIYTFEGRKRYMKLKEGGYPDVSLADAREAFDIAKVKVKNGIDPLAEKQQAQEARSNAFTVADLINEYIEKHAKKFKRSWQDDERLLNKEVVPVWGKRKVEDIKKRDVTLLLENIVDRGTPAMSNQTLKIVRKMFNFAVERDILQHTPFVGVKALAPNNSRERTLTETEIKTLWVSLNTAVMSDDIRRALKLVLVTAQRPGEVTGMHTMEIDGSWWTIPADRSKNGKAHRVYLSDIALHIINEAKEDIKQGLIKHNMRMRKEKKPEVPITDPYSGYIFPCPHRKKEQSIDSHALPVAVRRNLKWPLTDAKGKLLYDAEGKPATENRLGIEHFTPHDLRRTAATFMACMGYMDEVIDAVLNHVKKGIIRTYNRHDYDKEKRQALVAWERKLRNLTDGVENKDVGIR